MGRLQALMGVKAVLGIAFGVLAVACEADDEKKARAPAERSQAVVGTAPVAATPAATPAKSSPAAAPKPRKALCGGRLDSEGKAAPKKAISRRAAAGEAEPPAEPALTGGYTWVNFWAAWCVPCREEIPRLLSWQKKLGESHGFRVVFVSLDDDERQLEKFLAEQPAGGVRSTYWLREGREREDWLSTAGLSTDPELPVHLLVDAKGKVRCRVQGAVEDADLPDLTSLLKGS